MFVTDFIIIALILTAFCRSFGRVVMLYIDCDLNNVSKRQRERERERNKKKRKKEKRTKLK